VSDAIHQAVTALARWDPKSARAALKGVNAVDRGERGTYLAWVHGVLRRRRTLGTVLGNAAKRAVKGRPPEWVAALEVTGYRLLFEGEPLPDLLADLERLPVGKKAQAHVARVLTALADAVDAREPRPAHGDDGPADDPKAEVLPVSRSEQVRFRKPLLLLGQRNAAGRLGVLHSLPDPLVEAWLRDRGHEQAEALCWAANDSPPLFGRVQPLKGSRESLLAELVAEGIEATPCELPGAFRLDRGRGRFRFTAPWKHGRFSIQDLTAQRAAPLLAPQAGESILDLCAAPGGKTTAIAELSEDRASILACDKVPRRLRRVDEGAARLGLTSIRTRPLDAARDDAADQLLRTGEGPFDAVLVDAPCSNTGVLRRRSEARWRYDAKSQRRIVRQQSKILAAAVALTRPGGRLVYSLCSVERDEGEGVVRAALEAHRGLTLVEEQLHLPSEGGGDGGFLALLRKA
jgi:16S rRNA (cytosine967-C5)-methyltransferase